MKEPFIGGVIHNNMKYQYPFIPENEQYTHSFLSCGDPYGVSIDDKLRSKWIDEAKMIYGDFIPSGPSKPIHCVSKSLMKEIVDCVKRLLLSDWNDVNFVLGSKFFESFNSIANPNDFIEVKFDTDTVDNPTGLHSYMNTLLNTNDDIIRYQLRKISYYWGYREGNFVYYMFAPPWLKVYIVSLYLNHV